MTNLPSAACAPHISHQGHRVVQAATELGLPVGEGLAAWLAKEKEKSQVPDIGSIPLPPLTC